MSHENDPKNDDKEESNHPDHGPTVTITVNGHSYTLHRGRRTVVEIKQVAGVPLAYDLEQVIAGVLTPLPDDGSVVLKGGEAFVSHPKDAGSSHE
jgi:hypothetical protein